MCGFSFEKTYGEKAKGYIHVHHLVPLAEVGASYEVDPAKDLRPVCPNCHSVIHLNKVNRTIEEVAGMLQEVGNVER
ncbi:MAG: HNH endonuclease [Planctomycetota bacterium]|nr:HNH endonuclease [Planctomycetota bacterium]MDA1113448.1 HNH endonuclease [Planctomycetota bacterium]